MDKALVIQLLGSTVAISLLVAVAAWGRIPRPTPPLDDAAARALLALEFPDHAVDSLWIAADGAGVIARSGDEALILWRKGDGYVARDAPWSQALSAQAAKGRLTLKLADGRPRFALSEGAWPPAEFVSREVAA